MDAGIVEAKGTTRSLDLEGLHGTSRKDIYVSGSKGFLHISMERGGPRFLFRRKWPSALSAAYPKITSLSWETRERSSRAKEDNRTVIQVPGHEDSNFSDVESFGEDIQIASEDRLLVRRGKIWSAVKDRTNESARVCFACGRRRPALGNGAKATSLLRRAQVGGYV